MFRCFFGGDGVWSLGYLLVTDKYHTRAHVIRHTGSPVNRDPKYRYSILEYRYDPEWPTIAPQHFSSRWIGGFTHNHLSIRLLGPKKRGDVVGVVSFSVLRRSHLKKRSFCVPTNQPKMTLSPTTTYAAAPTETAAAVATAVEVLRTKFQYDFPTPSVSSPVVVDDDDDTGSGSGSGSGAVNGSNDCCHNKVIQMRVVIDVGRRITIPSPPRYD